MPSLPHIKTAMFGIRGLNPLPSICGRLNHFKSATLTTWPLKLQSTLFLTSEWRALVHVTILVQAWQQLFLKHVPLMNSKSCSGDKICFSAELDFLGINILWVHNSLAISWRRFKWIAKVLSQAFMHVLIGQPL